jgi:hypothetical protein
MADDRKLFVGIMPGARFTDLETRKRNLTIEVKDEKFEVHKMVLIFHSPVFETMLESKNFMPTDGTLKLDHDPGIFKIFLDLLYHKAVEFNITECAQLINMVHFYGITCIQETLEEILLVGTKNYIKLYEASLLLDIESIKAKCLAKFIDLYNTVPRFGEDVKVISGQDMISIVTKIAEAKENVDRIQFSKMVKLITFIHRWMHYRGIDDEDVTKFSPKLMEFVDFDKLTIYDLKRYFNMLVKYHGKEKIMETILKKFEDSKMYYCGQKDAEGNETNYIQLSPDEISLAKGFTRVHIPGKFVILSNA